MSVIATPNDEQVTESAMGLDDRVREVCSTRGTSQPAVADSFEGAA